MIVSRSVWASLPAFWSAIAACEATCWALPLENASSASATCSAIAWYLVDQLLVKVGDLLGRVDLVEPFGAVGEHLLQVAGELGRRPWAWTGSFPATASVTSRPARSGAG